MQTVVGAVNEEAEMSDRDGLVVLLVVAGAFGAFAQVMAGRRVIRGGVRAVILGIVGAWIGSALIPFGPSIAGIQVVSAIAGAALLVVLHALLGGQPTRRRAVNRRWGAYRRLSSRMSR